MKLFFVFIVFFSLSKRINVESIIYVDKLEIKNHCFLYDFFERDITITKKYWEQSKNGLEQLIFIDIKKQQLNVLELSDTFKVILKTKISSGKSKNSTPRGEFKIIKKRISRPSRKYGGVMTFWNCITYDESIGIHGLKDESYEKNLGKPVSHGCIRVSTIDAKIIYNNLPIDTKVLIK